jgi:hypothetical protein
VRVESFTSSRTDLNDQYGHYNLVVVQSIMGAQSGCHVQGGELHNVLLNGDNGTFNSVFFFAYLPSVFRRHAHLSIHRAHTKQGYGKKLE